MTVVTAIIIVVAIVLIAALAWHYARSVGLIRSNFTPIPVEVCGPPYDDEYGVDMMRLRYADSPRNEAGTVFWDPYSTQSRVSLERYAESPEVAEAPNPITGLGKTSSVRAMGDRYRRDEALSRRTIYDLQPGEPGYMEEVGDHAMNLMAKITRRSPPVAGAPPPCLISGSDVDSDFYTDGAFGEGILKETLTSTRYPRPNTLTASKTGLGSTRIDPRFEPGPNTRTPDGDASWSHGGGAGGPTSGAWASSRFPATNNWNSMFVYGFGDDVGPNRAIPEAMMTEVSDW